MIRKLGILGGGQLGRMLIQEATDWNLDIHTLDGNPNAPCCHTATRAPALGPSARLRQVRAWAPSETERQEARRWQTWEGPAARA